jgi:hypothetical protein
MKEPGERSPALVAQVLGVEHWSLLATRGAIWQEIFSRTATFLTILSATMVALSLVVQASGFGPTFRIVALVVLPLVLFIGLATFARLVEADVEDAWLVVGMNRLRHAYVELAPEIEQYLVTGRYDDEAGVLQTYGFRPRIGVTHLFAGSPIIIGIVDALISGVLVTIVGQTLGAPTWAQVIAGAGVAISVAVLLCSVFVKRVSRFFRDLQPRFPAPSINDSQSREDDDAV